MYEHLAERGRKIDKLWLNLLLLHARRGGFRVDRAPLLGPDVLIDRAEGPPAVKPKDTIE